MENFDPESWVSLFEESGARHIVAVAELHDGYASNETELTKRGLRQEAWRRRKMKWLVVKSETFGGDAAGANPVW